jgi:hypothetical protein
MQRGKVFLVPAYEPTMSSYTRGAVKSSGTARADAKFSDALYGCFLDNFVTGEPEVVVGGEVQAFLAVNDEVFSGLAKRTGWSVETGSYSEQTSLTL